MGLCFATKGNWSTSIHAQRKYTTTYSSHTIEASTYSHRQLTDHMPIHLPSYLYTLELRMFSNVYTNCYPSPLASRRFVHGRESATGTMNVKGISEHAAVKGEETTEWK